MNHSENDMHYCKGCILYNETKSLEKFSSGSSKVIQEALKLIHGDMWGKATSGSKGGAQNFVTMYDD